MLWQKQALSTARLTLQYPSESGSQASVVQRSTSPGTLGDTAVTRLGKRQFSTGMYANVVVCSPFAQSADMNSGPHVAFSHNRSFVEAKPGIAQCSVFMSAANVSQKHTLSK